MDHDWGVCPGRRHAARDSRRPDRDRAAGAPEPAAGPSHVHLAFAASCVFTTAVWPLFVARRAPAPSWSVSISGCAAVTTFFAALSGWLVFASLGGGGLGLGE